MSNSLGTQQQHEEEKVHGDALEGALHSGSRGSAAGAKHENHAIPAPEDGGHPLSQAAHLGGHVHEHTKPAGNLRQGAAPGELREPPMVVSRVGKEHRKQ